MKSDGQAILRGLTGYIRGDREVTLGLGGWTGNYLGEGQLILGRGWTGDIMGGRQV